MRIFYRFFINCFFLSIIIALAFYSKTHNIHNMKEWKELINLSEEEIENITEEYLSQMNLYQKAFQMSGDIPLISGLIQMMIRYNSIPLPAGKDESLDIEGILFSDGPRGIVLNSSTCFPVSMARGASWDIELEERIGNAIGIEGRSQGANFYGGVCINLLRHPAWGRAQETYGEDTYHLGEMGAALVRGVQKHMMACVKHYACNSIENARFKVDVKISERTLREVFLPHFKRCVDEGCASIMSSYNKVNDEYASHSHHLLTKILREDWGFKGFVVSDFTLAVRDGKKAIKAGLDIEMPNGWRMRPGKIVRWVKKKKISEDLINSMVKRIIKTKLRFNIPFDSTLYSKDKVVYEEHQRLALEAAEKSIVLLKNENALLPLNKNQIKKIGVFGALANIGNFGDFGSSRVRPPFVITPLEGLKKLTEAEIIYDQGKNGKRASKLAAECDIAIIVAGYTHKDEGEYIFPHGGDRKSLTLRPEEENLIVEIAKVQPKTIVIMEGGSAIITENWIDSVDAALMAWYPGMMGGLAMARILFGEVNPSAKLPCIFPKSESGLPFFDSSASQIEYGYYHGYHLLDKEGKSPRFPFGFGLSYSKFEYGTPKLKKNTLSIASDKELEVSITVKNISQRKGYEIIQLYIGNPQGEIERFIKELKDFKKILIDAGQTAEIQFHVPLNRLAYFEEESKTWKIQTGTYRLLIGASSEDKDVNECVFVINP